MRGLRQSLWVGMLLTFALVLLSCGEKSVEKTPAGPESFTFFGVGANTVLTDGLRRDLEKTLGNGGVSSRNTIDMEINYPGFLSEHFPTLAVLNRRLNSSAGIRVEHDATRLTYRYLQNRETPFDYVELLFSDATGRPLLVNIRSDREGPDIIDTLRQNYGEPRSIDWGGEINRSLVWEKQGDVLIFSVQTNQFDAPVYRIDIFYVDQLEALVEREEKEQMKRTREKEKAIDKAFS